MSQHWAQPDYTYATEPLSVQWKRLFGVFIAANGGMTSTNTQKLMTELKMINASHVTSLQKGIKQTRFDMTSTKLEDITGIDMDRLLVEDAKCRILQALEDPRRLAKDHPRVVFLLGINPNLALEVRAFPHTSREDIITAIQLLAEDTSGVLAAKQLLADPRSIANWWSNNAKLKNLPANESLMSAIILLAAGPIERDDELQSTEDVRFRICARNILGPEPDTLEMALGVRNLQEALTILLRGSELDTDTVIADRLGLTPGVAKNLRTWRPGNGEGRIMPKTHIQLIRTLLERSHPNKLQRFDAAAEEFLVTKNKRGWVSAPVFWPEPSSSKPDKEKRERASSSAPLEPSSKPDPAVSASTPKRSMEASAKTESPAVASGPDLSVAEMALFKGTVVTLKTLVQGYPELVHLLPTELRSPQQNVPKQKVEAVEPAVNNGLSQDPSLLITRLATSPGAPSEQEFSLILTVIGSLKGMLSRVLQAPLGRRQHFAKEADQRLVDLWTLVDAADEIDLHSFLRFAGERKLAESLSTDQS